MRSWFRCSFGSRQIKNKKQRDKVSISKKKNSAWKQEVVCYLYTAEPHERKGFSTQLKKTLVLNIKAVTTYY